MPVCARGHSCIEDITESCVNYLHGELHHCALIKATFVWKVAAVNIGTQSLGFSCEHTHTGKVEIN